MKSRELSPLVVDEVFRSLGGKITKDRDSTFWLFAVDSVVLEIEPFLRFAKAQSTIGIDVSFSSPDLSRLVEAICGREAGGRHQFKWQQWQEPVEGDENIPVVLREILEAALVEARSIRLDLLVDELATGHPGAQSLSQLMHLAALSRGGNTGALQKYRDGMRVGKRFGFVPMINEQFIERAIEQASKE